MLSMPRSSMTPPLIREYADCLLVQQVLNEGVHHTAHPSCLQDVRLPLIRLGLFLGNLNLGKNEH